MYKQIIIFFILVSPVLLSAQEDNTNKFSVYWNDSIVGYLGLGMETTFKEDGCYTLDTLILFEKKIIVQTEVFYSEYQDTIYFLPNFGVELEIIDNEAIIKFNSTVSGDTYWLLVKKEKSEVLYIYEEFLWYSNSSVHIEIAKDEFNDFKCYHICGKEVYKLVDEKIVFTDYFHFDQNKECFDCPTQYSFEECLKMKKNNDPFIWTE